MHPYGPSVHYWHRRPNRLVWFLFGAAAATWWIKHKEERIFHSSWGHCVRPPIQAPAPTNPEVNSSWSPRDIPKAINNLSPANTWDSHQTQSQSWDEKERVIELSRKAGDKMTELSEATLDTVLTTVEVLKAKLAEHRAERDKQLQAERKRNEENQNPPRLV